MKSLWLWIVGLVLVVVLLWVTGVLGRFGLGGGNQTDYQAVFMSNGQVYFGKYSNGGSEAKLTDIYYLQVQQQIQPEGEQKPDVKLVKLGNEIHGPRDEMRINPDQIVFVEDLKEDGKVVTAIRAFQRGETPNTDSTSTDTNE